MKRFFIQIGFFLLVIMIVIGVSSSFGYHLLKKYILSPENFQLQDSVKILFIGDSQIGMSLNPNFIPHSTNQSIVAEQYVYVYCRLKYFLENNPQLETVILSFNHANLSIKWDRNLYESQQKASFFSKEFMLLGKDELDLLYSTDLLYFRNYLTWRLGFPTRDNIPIFLKILTNNFSRKDLPFYGSFIESGTNYNVSNAKRKIEDAIGLNETPEIAEIQMEYLNKIIRLCKLHNVRLILYSSPISSSYYDLIPDFYKTEFNRIGEKLSQEVPWLNEALYPLPDSCFIEANHTNCYGAEIISRKVATALDSLKR